MTGFEDAFDAQLARSREKARAVGDPRGGRSERIARLRAAVVQQLTAAGQLGVSKLCAEQVAPVALIADRGPFRRNVRVGSGWPLQKTSYVDDYDRVYYQYRWFLLDDGRLAPNRDGSRISQRVAGGYTRIDQLELFEQAYRWLIEQVDIVESSSHGRVFGGLVRSGTKYSTSTYSPSETEWAFHESAGQLMYQRKDDSAGRQRELISVEVAVAELVAQAVLDPPPADWR